jgi:protease-4
MSKVYISFADNPMNIREQFGNLAQRGGDMLGMAWQRLLCRLLNLRRRLLRRRLADYPVLVLNQAIEERTPAQPWWYGYLPGYRPPLTMEEIAQMFQRMAGDPDVRGVVILIKELPLGLAQAQSLAALFGRFRQWDSQHNPPAANRPAKQIVVHLEQITRANYMVACAADKICITPLTTWEVLGFYSAPTFWKESLAFLGIQMDVVKVAPWKTALDNLSQSSMTAEYAAQTQWLLDSLYADLVTAIQRGRKLSATQVQTLIDGAPWNAEQALAHSLVDAIAYEDELPARLGSSLRPAILKPYAKVRSLLWRHPQRRHPQAIGVISLTGAIIPGESRSLPLPLPILGDAVLGHLTAQQQIRAARQAHHLAAVVVHVDSRGGSALASDLIWRELSLLNQEKPVVVYMGDVAASGGYYIALPSRKIVAQRATLTGSIGVIIGKPVLQDAYAKVRAQRYTIQRGAHAGLYSEDRSWATSQRQKITEAIDHSYQQFKQRVAADRKLAYEALDDLANGRLWTGAQAAERGLVDALGDFQVAVDLACEAAGLPTDGGVVTIDLTPPKQTLLAEPGEAIKAMLKGDGQMPIQQLMRAWGAGAWVAGLTREHCWWLAVDLPELSQ